MQGVMIHCTGEWCPGKNAEGAGRTEWRKGLVLRGAASVVVNPNCQLDGIWDQWRDGLLGMSVGALLIRLIEVRRPAHCGWQHPLAGSLDYICGEKGLSRGVHYLLLPDYRRNGTGYFKLLLPRLRQPDRLIMK